jgi:hypothetical protein
MLQRVLVLLLLSGCFACQTKTDQTLFRRVDAGQSGIDFANTIQEDEHLNVLTYQYLYNGGGVAVGDVNNDGRPDIYFSGNQVPNRLYLNQGELKFTDVTGKAGVAGRKNWKTGVSMADVNADGRLDIYVCYSGPGSDGERRNELFINEGVKDGVPVFSEQAARYGIDAPGTFSTQATFFDYDHDNDLDMFLVNHGDMFYNAFYNTAKLRNTRHPKFGNRLYRNDNGRFFDVSADAGIDGSGLNFGLSASMGDVNNDGWPDIYVTNDYNERDFLYLNQQNGHFREVLPQAIGHISKFSMGSNVVDVDNDLSADIITLDMLPEDNRRQKLLKGPDEYDAYQLLVTNGFHHQQMRNMLQLNRGTNAAGIPQFSEVGQLAGISNTDWSWSPLVGDFDNDGRKDLFITNGYLRDFTNLDFLKFTYQEADEKARASGQQLNTWKLVQQMPSTKTSNYCFANQTTGGATSFRNVTQNWGLSDPSISTGAAHADLDNDGDLDLIVSNSNDLAALYENRSQALSKNHYLSVRLRDKEGRNTEGIGAKVILQTALGTQMQELYPASSFQSSNDPGLHFGLGDQSVVQSLRVLWPDGRESTFSNLKADTSLVVGADKATRPMPSPLPESPPRWYSEDRAALDYVHHETPYVDFKHQSLLPYQPSKLGPFLAEGDVDGDGLVDVFVGGNAQQAGALFIQQSNGQFRKASAQPWGHVAVSSDMGSVFFDADRDGDLDFFLVRGGVEQAAHDSAYQDMLYLNDGKGEFKTAAPDALPNLTANGSCVTAADYDRDGDMDLFVGGRTVPGQYPETDFSYLLKNIGTTGRPRFAYASEQRDQTLRHPGIVNSAVWADLNRDGWPELIVAGELMPVTVYKNQRGTLVNATRQYGLESSRGLWQKIAVADLDHDGDLDLIAGNMGLNNQFHASEAEPLSVCYGDFDQNGTVDPLLCYYVQGKNFPLASLDELAGHFPAVRKKFVRYADYAGATLDNILSPEQRKQAKTLTINTLRSTCFIQQTGGTFNASVLPYAAQVSAVSGIVITDVNRDGHNDLVLAGNFYPWRVQLGRSDASAGSVCLGNGKGQFTAFPSARTGLDLTGDVRDLRAVPDHDGSTLLVASRHNDRVSVVKQSRQLANVSSK